MRTLHGWRQVPWYLMTSTQLRVLEFPRMPAEKPVAEVVTSDWRGRRAAFDLHDARTCPPTAATGRQLAAAERRSGSARPRRCSRCGARSQRPLAQANGETGPVCPLCRRIAEIERTLADLAAERAQHVARAGALLAQDQVAVLEADHVVPPDSERACAPGHLDPRTRGGGQQRPATGRRDRPTRR